MGIFKEWMELHSPESLADLEKLWAKSRPPREAGGEILSLHNVLRRDLELDSVLTPMSVQSGVIKISDIQNPENHIVISRNPEEESFSVDWVWDHGDGTKEEYRGQKIVRLINKIMGKEAIEI